MRWSEDFETGLADLDSQHRQLFEFIQRIHLWENDVDRSEIHRTLVNLGRLARRHFDYEDWLMAAYGYPSSSRHAVEHDKLMIEVEGYQSNAVFRPRQLARVLGNWLISHTLQDDRPLAHHVQQLRASGIDISPPKDLNDAFAKTALDVGLVAHAQRPSDP